MLQVAPEKLKPRIMKRQVLFIGYESSDREEIREFIAGHEGEVLFAESTDRAIRILDEHPVTTVVLRMQKLTDAAILRYINLHKPGIGVVVTASEEFDHIINVFSNGQFKVMPHHHSLEELEEAM